MTLTIRDISPAHREDIEALYIGGMTTAENILVAVAEQLECFERRAAERTETTEEWGQHQTVLQVWEAAYEAAGGVMQR